MKQPGLLKRTLPPPVLAALIAVGMWQLADLSHHFVLESWLRWPLLTLLVVAGVACDLTSVITFLRRKTVINPFVPHKSSTLVLTGAFRYSRNPMYLGLVLLLTAWALYLSAWWPIAGPLGFFVYIDRCQIPHEEAALKSVFGEPYLHYLQTVRRWL